MYTLSATTIFWLLTLGLFIGWAVDYFTGHEGMTTFSNLVWGAGGSLISGVIALIVGMDGVILFAFMGTTGILFIANTFHLHHEVDILKGDVNRRITIKHRDEKYPKK